MSSALQVLQVSRTRRLANQRCSYRLGVCGFLDSTQLRAKGYPPNRGLLDQQMAFRWLQKNISGFGGNPDEITAMGHSAGSCKGVRPLGRETSLLFDNADNMK